MSQLDLDEELGRGNYGTVKKVLHKPTNVAMAMKVSYFLALGAAMISSVNRRKYAWNWMIAS